ncbi:MAG: LuxR family transcriptional regulator [Alphaproteobacteria bacterium]|nr:LuxR family transcriptional regulator [Alphaproteobacteria bacterium]
MTAKVANQRLKHGTEVPHLRKALEEFTASSGYRYYTYITGRVVGGRRITNIDPRERPFHITNLPGDWKAEYSKNQYYDHDPTMLFALGNLLPERWSNVIRRFNMTAKQHKIMSDSREAGLHDGVIIPVHGPSGEFAVLSLSHGENDVQAQHNVELDEAVLHMFALRFHNNVRSQHEPSVAEMPASLTSREIDVLFWTAEGKSSWDISQILDISESTVNFHINSAKRKLGVYSKTHAVAKMYSFQDRELF